MAELAEEIKSSDILVAVCGENYQNNLLQVIKATEEQFNKIGYVSLNKPYNVLMEFFKKNGVDFDRFLIIDCITKTVINRPQPVENCIYMSSPNALTETNIAISKACEHLEGFIFDSLSALLVYEKEDSAIKFVHSLTNCFRTHKIKVIFTILVGDLDSTLMKDLKMFADKIIKF